MANTRAPTYTGSSNGGWAAVATDQAIFRKKGGTLVKKLQDVFQGYDRSIESAFGNGMQVSACTLFGGGTCANVFHWTAPVVPCFVDHLVIHITTGGTSGGYMILGRATITGAAQNTRIAANRAIANTFEGASRKDILVATPISTATIIDTQKPPAAYGVQRSATFLYGASKHLTARAITKAAGTLAGTVYVFWYKTQTGAAD